MEWYEYLTTKWHIDVIIVAIVFLSGMFQEKYFRFELSKDKRYSNGLKTLFLSLLVGVIYALIVYHDAKVAIRNSETPDMSVSIPLKMYFISYFAATSLYDMAVRPFRNWLNKKFGNKEETEV
jgi:hypothetical protein